MAVTQITYDPIGSPGGPSSGQTIFSFPFAYLETTDIKVSLDGSVTTAYPFANATHIQFNTAPDDNVVVRIYRETDDTQLTAEFYPGSAIRSQDLNDNFRQSLYVAQETNERSVQADGAYSISGLWNFTTVPTSITPTTANQLATKGYVDSIQGAADIAKVNVAQTFSAEQTFTEIKETVRVAPTSGTFTLDPALGTIYYSQLNGSITISDGLESGQSMLFILHNGDQYVVNWPAGILWHTNAGDVAPALSSRDTVVIWKYSTTLYGAHIGSFE